MKNIMIKKINIVISLWLIALMIVLFIFGKELAMTGFYYACGGLAALLLATNLFTIASGLKNARKTSIQVEKGYRKY